MFEEYNPALGKMFQIMDDEGVIINPKYFPDLPDSKIVEAYKFMLLTRVADLRAVSYQRQGRMFTYPPNLGQEASAVGPAMAMKPEDWLVPAYRELGAWIIRGAKLSNVYLYWGGYEEGATFSGAINITPPAVPIASQTLHAVGIAYGLKYKKETNKVVFTYIGDGGTSEGDFNEALNFAGAWHVPVVFICQNNQYAISMPRTKQTAAKSIAIKSAGFGLKGIQVDGNDFFATYSATNFAANYVRQGGEAVLIECVTYRQGAHTTSDDPTRYRTSDEEKKWLCRDPLKRLRQYLINKNLWSEEADHKLEEQYGKEVDAQFEKEVEHRPYPLDDVFQYMYTEIPDHLKKQKIEFTKFLHWKESYQWQ